MNTQAPNEYVSDESSADGPIDFSIRRRAVTPPSPDLKYVNGASARDGAASDSSDSGTVLSPPKEEEKPSPTPSLRHVAPLPTAIMMEQQRLVTKAAGARPFKAYPKDPLKLPLGYYAIPGMLPYSSSVDSGATSVPNGSAIGASEDVINRYRMYMMKMQEQMAGGHGNPSSSSDTKPLASPPSVIHSPPSRDDERSTFLRLRDDRMTSPRILTSPNHPSEAARPSNDVSPRELISDQSRVSFPLPSTVSSSTNEKTSAPVSPAHSETLSTSLTPTGLANTTTSARKRPRTMAEDKKDEAYWERRRKNNEAAKRSRDARRAKEDEIAIRAAFLEQENLKLRVEVAALKNEMTKLRCMLYNS